MAVLWLGRLVAGFPPLRPGFKARSGYVGFVVDKAALGQVFSEYFGMLGISSVPPIALQSLSSSRIIRGWDNRPLVASKILDSVELHPKKKKKSYMFLEHYNTC
jgi:hypothetical protein